jgi:hypothetical protein
VFRIILSLIVAYGFFVWPVEAAVVKELQIETSPMDAEAFLLQGTKRTPLGKTPLKYEATFHSEISIIRIAFEKAGYETKIVEISASQNRIYVDLNTRGYTLSPNAIKDPVLRNLHQRIKPLLDKQLSNLPPSQGPYRWEVQEQVRVAALDEKTFLILPIGLTDPKKSLPLPASPVENDAPLQSLWSQLGREIVIPLAQTLKGEKAISGTIAEVGYLPTKKDFKVGSRVETQVEMECVPGSEMVQVYDSCASQQMRHHSDGRGNTRMSYDCVGGMVTRSVYNPCLYKAPVTRSTVVTDPVAKTEANRAKLQYVFSHDLLDPAMKESDIYSRLGIVGINEEGRIVLRRGSVPTSLPKIP